MYPRPSGWFQDEPTEMALNQPENAIFVLQLSGVSSELLYIGSRVVQIGIHEYLAGTGYFSKVKVRIKANPLRKQYCVIVAERLK